MVTIDQYSLATIPIQLFFNETPLSHATAFIWEHQRRHYLITNWHNVSGRDPNTDRHLSDTAAEPNRMRAFFNTKGGDLGDKHAVWVPLRNGDEIAWLVHPTSKRNVDIVAIQMTGDTTSRIEFFPVNEMPSENMRVSIGMDVFVLGYPFGRGATALPVWKRGSIASEPDLVPQVNRFFHVDTASRPGMSGSPVIVRTFGSYEEEGGGAIISTGAVSKFLGVYSGRLHTHDPLDAQIGMVWPAVYIDEIIAGQVKDYG